MNKTIPVVYCFDKSYAKYAAVSTHSLFLNSNSKLTVYWVVPDCDVHEVDELSKLLKIRGISITVLGVSDDYSVGRGGHAYISQATYLRIAIPYVVMEEKIIYIDSDTLILADLMELYNHEMYDKKIGGVIDLWRGGGSKIPLEDGDPYINSGVMLMNLSADTEPQKNVWMKLAGTIAGGCFLISTCNIVYNAQNVSQEIAAKTALLNQGNIGLIGNLGKVLFKDYVVPFEISSVLFLSAMVGAVVIGKKEKSNV
ncbi:MAG: hypothetical protein EB015_15700 [Methylocystaceae bacterium]|nr:hypothetical protein [Methylocystaceae bacterium]